MSELSEQLIEAAKASRQDGRLSDALRDVTRAVALCRESGDQLRLITSIKALGHITADLMDFEGSRSAYSEAVDLSRNTGDPLLLAHSIRHLGGAFSKLGDLERAETNYREALALYQGKGESSRLDHANALRALAWFLDANNRPAEAKPLWESACELYTLVDVQAGVMECSARLGQMWQGD